MPEVTCPRCGTRASLDAAAGGYACAECGAEWAFVTCANCRVRFHMRPGTQDWICPECGHENGMATMGAFEPDPEPVITGAPDRETSGQIASAAQVGDRPRRGPMSRAKLGSLALLGIATVLALAFAASALGDDGTTAAAPSTTQPSPSASLSATDQLCLHLRDLQTLREDALGRLGDTLKADATAIKEEGDAELGARVVRVRKAVLAYRDALAAQGDLTDVSAELGEAVGGLPCFAQGG